MDSPAQPHSVLRFGAFELDEADGELREDGTARWLPAQPFRVLVLLAERAGELVTRDEIQRYLWGDRNYLRVDHGVTRVAPDEHRPPVATPADDESRPQVNRAASTLPSDAIEKGDPFSLTRFRGARRFRRRPSWPDR